MLGKIIRNAELLTHWNSEK